MDIVESEADTTDIKSCCHFSCHVKQGALVSSLDMSYVGTGPLK